MFTDPVALIDQTISNLETLAALFADEFDERTHDANAPSPASILCRNAHVRIDALLPTLKAARATQQSEYLRLQRPFCIDCD